MLEVLNDLAENFASIRAFRENPEAYMDRFDGLTSQERQLLLEGDSGKVSEHVSGKANIETVIVVIIVAAAQAGDLEGGSFGESRHGDFWSHVNQRSEVLAA